MNYILYHANCTDGFGAAFSAWLKLGDVNTLYIPVSYGEAIPLFQPKSNIYILDFSYPVETLKEFVTQGHNVVLLDHHKTALESLGQDVAKVKAFETTEPGLHVKFDMGKSGALLAYEYFHPNARVPFLIQYVSDRDLWTFKMNQSREFSAGLANLPMEFEAWNKINVSDLISDGVLLLDQENKLVKRLIKNAYMTNIAGYTVPVVNTSLLMSEVGNKLLEEYPGASFAACYTENGTHTQYSLRSRGDFDVSAVAKQFGGGGHAAASGYKVPISRVSMNNVTVTVK